MDKINNLNYSPIEPEDNLFNSIDSVNINAENLKVIDISKFTHAETITIEKAKGQNLITGWLPNLKFLKSTGIIEYEFTTIFNTMPNIKMICIRLFSQ